MSEISDRSPHVATLSFPAEARWIALGRLVLSGLCQLSSVAEETQSDLKLAVTEACSNSVRHAYGEEPGSVHVRFEVGADYVGIEVSDDGQGIRRDPIGPTGMRRPDDLQEDEMGLAIIAALADEVEVGQGPSGRGTTTRFRKNLI